MLWGCWEYPPIRTKTHMLVQTLLCFLYCCAPLRPAVNIYALTPAPTPMCFSGHSGVPPLIMRPHCTTACMFTLPPRAACHTIIHTPRSAVNMILRPPCCLTTFVALRAIANLFVLLCLRAHSAPPLTLLCSHPVLRPR